MKVNLLETDDRFLSFKKQDFGTDEFLRNMIQGKPFGDNPYYIFQTTWDSKAKWHARLIRPIPQINSTLIRIPKNSMDIQVIWVIPPVEIWPEFEPGKIHANEIIQTSIYMFRKRFQELSQPFPDDLTGEEAQDVMFEFYPLLFQRDTLPEEKRHLWDNAKALKEAQEKKT